MVKNIARFMLVAVLGAGCSAPVDTRIPSIANDHPAQAFYQAAQAGMLSDRVCRDAGGIVDIPVGKIEKGIEFLKTKELAPGVFRFCNVRSEQKYLGVSFLQYSGMLQVPKVCSWPDEEPSSK